ncbi:MAG: hypothetical protein JWM98_687 [Thermoleophilia bacterium]|nr:hypothetical protein [Thermoleophilia bacterium]
MDHRSVDIPESWPPEVAAQRTKTWPVVNIIVSLRLAPLGDGAEPDFLASRAVYLPRVPCARERIPLLNGYSEVAYIHWTLDGRVSAHLGDTTVDETELDALRADGWTVFPRRDEQDLLNAPR